MDPLTYLDILAQKYPSVKAFDNEFAGNNYDTLEVTTESDPLPPKATLDAEILSTTRTVKWKEIQDERDRRKSGGVLVGANWFHSDDTSRIQFIGLMLYGANLPAGIMWKTMAGDFVEMTAGIVQSIFGTIAQKDAAIFSVAEQRKAIINSMQDPSGYDHLGGSPVWPAVYGE